MWNHYEIQRVLKKERALISANDELNHMLHLFEEEIKELNFFKLKMRHWILSGFFSVAHLWQQSALHWDCARILSLQISLITRYGHSKIRQHQKRIGAVRKLQSGSQQLRVCLMALSLPSWEIMSTGMTCLPCKKKKLRMMACP